MAGKWIQFDTIDSTNSYAKQLIRNGAEDGTLIVAGQQTGGRGRSGRTFYSPPGTGLYLSLIRTAPDEPGRYVFAAAVAAVEAIALTTGIHTQIKWVNDLYLQGRKVGGILTELEQGAAVIGIGINCNTKNFPEEIRGTAGALSETPLDREKLAEALWERLLYWTDRASDPSMMAAYRSHSLMIGREISWQKGTAVCCGTALGIDDDGRLVVRNSDQMTSKLDAGEVQLIRLERGKES